MKISNRRAHILVTVQILLWVTIAAPAAAHPLIDNDDPGYSAGTSGEYTASGNPLDQSDLVFSVWGSYRTTEGFWGVNASAGYAHPTSSFARSLGRDAELLVLDFSLVRYLNYPPEIDRNCDGKQAPPGHIQPWHCGRHFKSEPYLFAGPGLALLWVDDAFPTQPITDASKDFFTVNFGFGLKFYRLKIDESEELAPGLSYQPGYRKSRWYLRPEVRGRWFTGRNDEIDWSIGLGIGYSFDKGRTNGALCLQVEETCHLAQRVAEQRREIAAAGLEVADEYFDSLQARRDQLQEYQVLIREAGADCGSCIEESTAAVNTALTAIRQLPSSGDPE